MTNTGVIAGVAVAGVIGIAAAVMMITKKKKKRNEK